jgi:hypothetical protein
MSVADLHRELDKARDEGPVKDIVIPPCPELLLELRKEVDKADPDPNENTRIAGSDAQIWRAILEQNRDEVLRALSGFEDELLGLRTALANRDYTEVAARIERGKAYRDQFRPLP